MICIEPLSPSLFMGEGFGVGVNQVFQQSPQNRPYIASFSARKGVNFGVLGVLGG